MEVSFFAMAPLENCVAGNAGEVKRKSKKGASQAG